MKKGILLVSVGTSQLEALEHTTIRLREQMMEYYKECNCYLAFSSQHIIKKMNQKLTADETAYFNLSEALEQMITDKIEQVFIQPTYLLNGLENDSLLEAVETYRTKFQQICMGKPLLSEKQDYIQALYAILEEVKLEEGEALVLVGHGSSHLANSAYQNLEYTAYTQGQRNVFVGTVEGGKSQRMTLRKLEALGYQKVRLMPLLFVAGYHAKKDIAADAHSWKSILEEAGYEVKTKLMGLGEIEGIRMLFMEHLKDAMQRTEMS